MDLLTPDLIMWLIGQIIVSTAIWGAIRADIKNIHREQDKLDRRIEKLDGRVLEAYAQLHTRVAEAHQRIDSYTGHRRDTSVQ